MHIQQAQYNFKGNTQTLQLSIASILTTAFSK